MSLLERIFLTGIWACWSRSNRHRQPDIFLQKIYVFKKQSAALDPVKDLLFTGTDHTEPKSTEFESY